jgi:Family of unknown function (DUF5994)
MTSVLRVRPSTNSPTQAPGLRLRLDPGMPGRGSPAGTWWPRSRDLSAELPPLLAELAAGHGRIGWVAYNLAEWDPAPRCIRNGDVVVRLGGFRTQVAGTIDVTADDQHRFMLLVVPPEADGTTAEWAMTGPAATDTGLAHHPGRGRWPSA